MPEVRDFLMPDLGEGLTEGEIARWLVTVDDVVDVDQPIAELSTEKAVVEVPTPFKGRVVQLHGEPGDIIKVGTPLISIEVGEQRSDSASGNVLVGYGTNEEPASRRQRVPAGAVGAPTAASPASATTPPASPRVRRLAAELGIELSGLVGSGPGGIITAADVERAGGSGQPAAGSDTAPGSGAAGETRRRLIGVDRVAAERLTRSHQEIPTATATTTADATALLALAARLDSNDEGLHVTPFALVLRACVATLQRSQRLNAHFDTAANELVMFDAVHLGVAVQTDRGLVVPVIHDAQDLTALQLAGELERVATGARAGTLAASELTGSTFTVSNFGAFGVDGGTAIINPPEVGILGVGRIAQRPWIIDGQPAACALVQLSLVFDHRVADGAVGGGFMRALADLIEQPGELEP